MSGAPPPTPEQRAAIERRDRDVFCEAGAGTGKTRVLVGRYCDALVGGEAEIDQILAFTFTERAATELKQRIRRELAERAADAGDPSRARELRTMARETERAWVTTIHGFCARILRTHPVAAGIDPLFRVLDESEATRLRDQAAREAINGLVAEGDEEVARVAASYQAWRLAQIALLAHTRLRAQGVLRPRLPDIGEPLRSGADQEPLTPREREAARAAISAAGRVLERMDARYEELKSRRSGLDFADLELRAVATLAESDAVADLWRGRFRHVMVDEFQDTNAVQLRLVESLRGVETRLFTVGDENQSIYRFRGAELEVFRSQRAAASADPHVDVLPLRGNFRSRQPVIAAANLIGEALLEGFGALVAAREDSAPGTPAPVELLLTLNEGRGAKHRKWSDHSDPLDLPPSASSAHTVAQARFLAERLAELVRDEGVAAGDIVVLLRAFTHVDAYEEALRRYGLEPYVVGGRGYWSQQQVEDLLRLLGAVANPLDDEMLFGALACPAVRVSPDAMWLLRAAAGPGVHVWPALEHGFGGPKDGMEPAHPEHLEEIARDDADRLRRFTAILTPLRAASPLLPLDSLVERTMDDFGYDLALLARSQPDGRMANVRKLMRLAAEFERNEGRDLRGFLVQAAEATKRDEREGQAPVQPEDHDGVRIMTVHGAKGLEFPVVAVPELDRQLDAAHSWADIRIGSPADGTGQRFGFRVVYPTSAAVRCWELTELDAEEKEAEAEESCRLVYVAATRARDRLILSGAYKPSDLDPPTEAKTNDTALRRVLPKLREQGWSGADEDSERPFPLRIRTSEPSDGRAAALAPPRMPDRSRSALDDPGHPPLIATGRRPVPVGHLSYSALDAYKRCGYRFYVERVLGVSPGAPGRASAPAAAGLETEPADERAADELPAAGAGARALGNAVHAALEWSARNSWGRPSGEQLASLLRFEGVAQDAAAARRARRLVDGWLDSPLRAELRDVEVGAEVPFVLPLGGTVLRGKMDLVALGAPIPTVVDFKTDRVGTGGVEELGERYASQRAVYALAVAAGGPVRTVHLFLESPEQPVIEEFDEAALTFARARLEGLLEQIRAGAFEPAAEPYEDLCAGCPAAPRLCPRPAWKPSRSLSAALR